MMQRLLFVALQHSQSRPASRTRRTTATRPRRRRASIMSCERRTRRKRRYYWRRSERTELRQVLERCGPRRDGLRGERCARRQGLGWQDKDGDWIETGLHIFFGAYPNMMNLLKELKIRDRLQWKPHRMSACASGRASSRTSSSRRTCPAPFNMAAAILTNREMLSLVDKVKMVPGLLPMLIEGQDFIDAQDELSVLEFMEKYGMPDTVNEEIFIAMASA